MVTSPEIMHNIDNQIARSDAAICRHIDNIDTSGRGAISQDILQNLRTFVEHVMFKIYAHTNNVSSYDYDHIEKAIRFVKAQGRLKFLTRFHAYLQIVVSHYTLDPEDSERVMIKYYEFMLKTKYFLKRQYGTDVFSNLCNFPLSVNNNYYDYYDRIAEKLTAIQQQTNMNTSANARYYIYKIKPFFVNQNIFL
jgi:hypothetical protein